MRLIANGLLGLTVALLVSSCSYVNPYIGLSDDNMLEELGERIIKNETGLDVDLSHESPEDQEADDER